MPFGKHLNLTKLVPLFALIVGGCGVEAASTTPSTLREYAVTQNQIACEIQLRCCGITCSTSVDVAFNKSIRDTERMVDAGLVKFDPAAASTCIESYRTRYTNCDTPQPVLPDLSVACGRVLTGTAQVGQSCTTTNPYACVSNAYCATNAMTGQATCTAYLKDGDSCATGGQCLPTSYCDPNVMSRVCRAKPRNGESCASSSCDTSGGKLVCLPSGNCGAPQDDGAMCANNSQCKSGICGPARTCTSVGVANNLRDAICTGR